MQEKDEFVKEIVTDLDKLSIRCDEVDIRKDNKIVQEIISSLKHTLRAHKENCVGLAANQIGYDKRIFVIRFGEDDLRTFINPVIVNAKGIALNRESCMSIPSQEFIRPRNSEIEVIYQTPMGKNESRKLLGAAAYVFQHELDHLDGLTLADIGLPVGEEFDKMSDEDKDQLIKEYADSLDLKLNALKEEINNDPELKQTQDAINFMDSVIKGETEVTYSDVDKETSKEITSKLKKVKEEE